MDIFDENIARNHAKLIDKIIEVILELKLPIKAKTFHGILKALNKLDVKVSMKEYRAAIQIMQYDKLLPTFEEKQDSEWNIFWLTDKGKILLHNGGMFKKVESEIMRNLNQTQIILSNDSNGNKSNGFEYSNLNKYISKEKIDIFRKIENELIDREFIIHNTNGKYQWSPKKTKHQLVVFIYYLTTNNVFRSSLPKKTRKTTLLEYKRLFIDRYNTSITKEMQPSRFDQSKLEKDFVDYYFLNDLVS